MTAATTTGIPDTTKGRFLLYTMKKPIFWALALTYGVIVMAPPARQIYKEALEVTGDRVATARGVFNFYRSMLGSARIASVLCLREVRDGHLSMDQAQDRLAYTFMRPFFNWKVREAFDHIKTDRDRKVAEIQHIVARAYAF